MESVQTFVGKRASWLGFVMGLATGSPLQEVPQSNDQDGDGGDTSIDTANDYTDGGRVETRQRYGRRGYVIRGGIGTALKGDETVDDELIGRVG